MFMDFGYHSFGIFEKLASFHISWIKFWDSKCFSSSCVHISDRHQYSTIKQHHTNIYIIYNNIYILYSQYAYVFDGFCFFEFNSSCSKQSPISGQSYKDASWRQAQRLRHEGRKLNKLSGIDLVKQLVAKVLKLWFLIVMLFWIQKKFEPWTYTGVTGMKRKTHLSWWAWYTIDMRPCQWQEDLYPP